MIDKNLTTDELWMEIHNKVYAIIDELTNNTYRHQVYWNDAMDNGNRFDNYSIVHYWSHTNKTAALNLNHKII